MWCEGYDSPLIEDPGTAIEKIAYIYHKPSKDGLTDTMDGYPGVNTYNLLKKCTTARGKPVQAITTYQIPRDAITPIDTKKILLEADYAHLRRRLIHKKAKTTFTIYLNGWMKRFGIVDPLEQAEVNRAILAEVRRREADSRAVRVAEKKTLIGKKRLVATPIGTPCVPDRTGKRMLVHSEDREIRKETIKWIKDLLDEGREVLECWRMGDTSVPYPLGLFPPTGIRLAEPIGW